MQKSKVKSIGLFGGSFDPPHRGHLKISNITIKKLELKKLYWTITRKNPFKKKSFFSLNERLLKCKKLINKQTKINVLYLEKKIKSSRTIKVLEYFKKKNKNYYIYLVIGSDNLINFHKWSNYKKILKICTLVVFPRKGYDTKAKKSVILKYLKNNNVIFIKTKKIDISSTELRNYIKKINGNK